MKQASLVLLILSALAFCHALTAQTNPDIFTRLESKLSGEGIVTVKQDPQIRDLVNLHVQNQKSLNGIMGYRISIFNESGQEANKKCELARAKFISRYEQVKSYKKFEYPFFKVYVGDFRSKSEALKFLKQIENDYPDAFITPPVMIYFPD